MKIIADMGGDKFLVEATGTEIANIIGVWNVNSAPDTMVREGRHRYEHSRVFSVGATFNVSPAYQWLAALKERRAEALRSTAIMRAFLDHVDGNIPEIVPPIILSPDDVAKAEKDGA
jgi:hypothetical protein